ncbi:hypothetical protein A3D62_03300 [Candidatus Kaiserbacteria bacterium RIFCSPHIGHO2_02_FULL_49_11]|uniref:Methyltransferase domain-containing protein n=1 Tax=Candidatus Kaiserbacteria bacterium RIFCSPHIGHO2_02_FULL_49_11 TaxID=1798489 RepID=A0A1F6D005_9BACT|nr:MAG: hypothetical protein A3D62_03300 [Candidatus Kaiserbacteria bacterium RIFCSPHIGHO2_02_FULL_49_11]
MRFSDPEANVEALKLEPSMHVADFGAGTGVYTFAAARRVGNRGKVYAIDIQPDLLRRIKNESLARGFDAVEVIWGDVDEPRGSGLPDQSEHAVIISNILFLADKKEELAKEAFRILKKGGRALVVDWRDSYKNMGPAQESVIREEAAEKIFVTAGFTIDRHLTAGAHHWGFIARK